MDVHPEEDEVQEIWAHAEPDICVLGVRTEQVAGQGEDGPPTILHHRETGRGILAVYDGAGGAGGGAIGQVDDGRTVTGAFLASRQLHFALEGWFRRILGQRRQQGRPCTELAEVLGESLQSARGQRRRKIMGTMVRELPSTIAAIEYAPRGGRIDLIMRWAGDSRCYRLIPRDGLQQLSQDDTPIGSSVEFEANDQPMTNMVSADRRFTINEERLIKARLPTVLVCATDGFFGYLQTPAHFEYVLLDTLRESLDPLSWAAGLAGRVRDYTKDDASLAIVALGFATFDELRDAYADRHEFVAREHWLPFQDIDPQNRDRLLEQRQSSWMGYRTAYERFIPEPKEAP
jgi:serine/threonine protein phosphatase PrpC